MLNKLTAKQVKDAATKGRLGDGGGLYLNISKTGAKSWRFIYRFGFKTVTKKINGAEVSKEVPVRKELGLGAYPAVTLAAARRKAEEARGCLAETPKRDPDLVWKSQAAASEGLTFGEYATRFMDRILSDFRNPKHRQQWRNTLTTYCQPIWDMDLDKIETPDILGCLEPIWAEKPETARRVRERLERVLDAAKSERFRTGDNPAAWRGNLQSILPNNRRAKTHHAAVPYADIPALMSRLSKSDATSANVLRFLILTGARSSEARGALWSEIDMDAATWTLPPDRMKAKREHVVPLSAPALQIIRDAHEVQRSELVWPGRSGDKPFSETALRKILRHYCPEKINGRFVTLHGFRSALRDWAGDKTTFSREVAELSIAHAVGDALERAYRRGNAIEKRRVFMDAWGDYCSGTTSEVVKLHG